MSRAVGLRLQLCRRLLTKGRKVRAVFWKHRRRYGARSIADELAELGLVCSPGRAANILKNHGCGPSSGNPSRPRPLTAVGL